MHQVISGRRFLPVVHPPTVQSGALHRPVELRLAGHLERHQHNAAAFRGDARSGAHLGRRHQKRICVQKQTDGERAEDSANIRPELDRKYEFWQWKVIFQAGVFFKITPAS